jgi:hypothetical protein
MVRGFPQGTAEFTWIPHLDMDVDVNEKNIDVTFHTNCNRKLNCKKVISSSISSQGSEYRQTVIVEWSEVNQRIKGSIHISRNWSNAEGDV